MPRRVAFYPCCATDITEPLQLLVDFADVVIFCDRRQVHVEANSGNAYRRISPRPEAILLVGDARDVIKQIDRIDVLFYRNDSSNSEYGSGLFVLGDSFLPQILERFPSEGGQIISDGSNSRGGNFKRMIRKSGLTKHGWQFAMSPAQPFLDRQALYNIDVRRVSPTQNDRTAL